MKKNHNITGRPNGEDGALMEAYRISFKRFTAAAAQLDQLPAADFIAREMALTKVEQARAAHSRSRDALVPKLMGSSTARSAATNTREAVGCCA
jgi:hypothetical protein